MYIDAVQRRRNTDVFKNSYFKNYSDRLTIVPCISKKSSHFLENSVIKMFVSFSRL